MKTCEEVEATSAEEAREKAKKLEDCELQDNTAELINWETTGEAQNDS